MSNYPVCLRNALSRTDSPIVCLVTVSNSRFCVLVAAEVKSLTAKAVVKIMCFAATCFLGSSCACVWAEDVADMVKICLSRQRLDSCGVRERADTAPLTLSEQHCHLGTQDNRDTQGGVTESKRQS